MTDLIVGAINFNDMNILDSFREAIQTIVDCRCAYFTLRFKPGFYFEVPTGSVPSRPGWYIILDNTIPIYVGRAEDLNARLNTNQGSLDNFAAKARKGDPERNFIKKFAGLGRFKSLRACVITQADLCQLLRIPESGVSKIDSENVEKAVNLFRGTLRFL